MVELICDNCSKIYKRRHKTNNKFHFCSNDCKFAFGQKNKLSEKYEETICEFCGEKFFKLKSLKNKHKKYFCSINCYQKQNNLQNVKCDFCKKSFHKKPGRITKFNFCSKECQTKFRTKHIPTDKEIIELFKNGLYDREIAETFGCSRGYVTKKLNSLGFMNRRIKIDDEKLRKRISDTLINKNRSVKNVDVYKTANKEARRLFGSISLLFKAKRDYICEECGIRGKKELHVHHKKMLSEIVKDFVNNVYDETSDKSIICQLMNYVEFTNEKNFTLLCIDCHKNEHYFK